MRVTTSGETTISRTVQARDHPFISLQTRDKSHFRSVECMAFSGTECHFLWEKTDPRSPAGRYQASRSQEYVCIWVPKEESLEDDQDRVIHCRVIWRPPSFLAARC